VKGFLFTHRSGETYKRYDNYGSKDLFEGIAAARKTGRKPLIVAVGGGVNGNSIGLIAAITGADFVEVPTTQMHYNDATTSAKKAFSLVIDDQILSKNILGAFYLPKLVYCVNEMLLTSSFANIHATIGESTKTMNMLGKVSSTTGARDYHNILGASEFASNTISIVRAAGGFDKLVKFVRSPAFVQAKAEALDVGRQISLLRKNPHKDEEAQQQLTELLDSRISKMSSLRSCFHSLDEEERESIKQFLTVVNREIVAAKAMFLAYSDPFEKYRALLFEYAHTLGHGVEAFANGLYARCRKEGISVPEEAVRLHGQCVGMAVLWAGQMSENLGLLEGSGLQLHQALGYLFNRHGGFSFKPLRDLCDEVGVTKAEFCEGVLSVVRRDNKRGYVASADPTKSVDQLVQGRPGKMAKSDDVNAELRYLVEVDEAWQQRVLSEAFDGEFDKVADLRHGELHFVASGTPCQSDLEDVAEKVYAELSTMYAESSYLGSF
jgi:3-dehydroquinate synthetase